VHQTENPGRLCEQPAGVLSLGHRHSRRDPWAEMLAASAAPLWFLFCESFIGILRIVLTGAYLAIAKCGLLRA
jgi:hypothetical protein